MAVLFFVLASMLSLAPGRDHAATATAIARVVLEQRPLFAYDETRIKTAAYLVSVAFRESSLRPGAIGDQGRARCLFQLWAAPVEVLSDAELCTRIALERLRESAHACGAENMLGVYAAGPAGCSSAKAKRISRDRRALAERLARSVAP